MPAVSVNNTYNKQYLSLCQPNPVNTQISNKGLNLLILSLNNHSLTLYLPPNQCCQVTNSILISLWCWTIRSPLLQIKNYQDWMEHHSHHTLDAIKQRLTILNSKVISKFLDTKIKMIAFHRYNRNPNCKIIVLCSLKDMSVGQIKTRWNHKKQIIVSTIKKLLVSFSSIKDHIIINTNLEWACLLHITNSHLSSMLGSSTYVYKSTAEAVGTEMPNPPNHTGSENSFCSSEDISQPQMQAGMKSLKC